MAQPTDKELFSQIRIEISTLEQQHLKIRSYLEGHEYDTLAVFNMLQTFRDTLNRVSAYVLTLYELKGQRTKITWEPLLANIDSALENMRKAAHPNPRTALEIALNMSEPNLSEVMKYLSRFKQSLK